ncbi:MAG: dihydrolipoyl dehydrogenase [Candidatus Omnitrophica bacterium]|nr:dihydrolipoyl dehydrogenase [Candidatus Omnitrophota bacterium]
MDRFDVAILGAGPGGYVAAIYLARSGKRVAVVEKDQLGGTCLNRGCIPTKALLSSVEVLSQIKEGASFGIDVASFKVNFERINSRKDEIVKRLRQGIDTLFKARKVTLFNGAGKLGGANTIEFSGTRVEAESIIIATGSTPLEIPAFRFNHTNIISSDDILFLKEVPRALIIIGGGVIGCEFAVIYNSLGAKVTIIEMMDEILPNMDKEVAKKLNLSLKKKGIKILTATKVEQLREVEGRISAVLASGEEHLADKALVSVGRKANSDNLGIEALGVKTERGRILVDERMATSVPNIYAIGDVAGKFQLAHVASYEGITAAKNICGRNTKADYKAVPSCVYTEPEVASVGLSEEVARSSGNEIKIARFPYGALGKAHVMSKIDGFVKLIGDKKTGKVLGAHILGADATNLIAEAALAIKKEISIEELGETIHAHPTLSEGLMEACHIFEDKGIHVL